MSRIGHFELKVSHFSVVGIGISIAKFCTAPVIVQAFPANSAEKILAPCKWKRERVRLAIVNF